MSDLDLLRGLGDQIVPPPMDALRETARRRALQARVAGTTATAAAVAAAIVGASFLTGDRDSTAPPPSTGVVDTTRPLTYAEGATIHVGDQTLTAPGDVVEIDLVDDGIVVRTDGGQILASDGGDLEQIGDLGDPGPAFSVEDHPYATSLGFVVSDNIGSRVGWLEFSEPGRPELVVYDARTRKELTRTPIEIEPGGYALLASVTDRFGYWYTSPETVDDDVPLPLARVDLTTGAQEPVTREMYEADRPPTGTPRTMMVSHAEEGDPPAYQVVDATSWQFAVGRRTVEPQGAQPLEARDGRTGKSFVFKTPAGYSPINPTWLSQWIDDDTVVLVATRTGRDELLECRFSTGACVLTLRIPESAVVPELG